MMGTMNMMQQMSQMMDHCSTMMSGGRPNEQWRRDGEEGVTDSGDDSRLDRWPPPPFRCPPKLMGVKMERLNSLTHACRIVVVLTVLLFGTGIAASAEANHDGNRVVALAVSGTDTLLKAYPQGVYRSGNGGESWQKVALPAQEDRRIAAIATSPADANVMYAAGPGLGVLRTDDGGKTWVARNEGLPKRDVIAVAAHTTQPETVYILVSEHGIYRSQDAGTTWRLMDRSPPEGMLQLIHSDMAGSMQTGWLFAATRKGVRRAMDCFCLWQDAGKLGTEAHAITYDPRQPKHIYLAAQNRLFRSVDGGESWVEIASPGSNVSVIALAFSRLGILYAVDERGDLFRSADEGGSWNPVNA